ncbi:MAG: class II aldolase/adducin family protein, partial [Planctomycetes bacterium]|nr:class II aldolase/adducin family protein [Planctomycetota bacterium]
EVFLGDIPITRYETPGGQKFADTVKPYVKNANVLILANHGTVSFGETVEKAYWWTEILDAYCRILMLAKDLGRVTYLSAQETKELLDLKQKWGYSDPRLEKSMENCDICANDVFRSSWGNTGVNRKAFDAPPPMGVGSQPAAPAPVAQFAPAAPAAPVTVDYDTIVKAVTEQVCRELGITAA